MFRALIPVLIACALSACVSQPDIYAPPAQRRPLDRELLSRIEPLLAMDDPNADAHIVADILKRTPDVPWRWTRKRPEIQLPVRSVTGFKFHAAFAIADQTFQSTGPVTITFFVNEHALASVTYDSPGQKTFEKPVPGTYLKEMSQNRLAAEIDKVWIAPGDQQPLGFILLRMGLLQ